MYVDIADWGLLIAFYVLMNVARGLMVAIFYPFLKYFAYGFDWRQVKSFIFDKK